MRCRSPSIPLEQEKLDFVELEDEAEDKADETGGVDDAIADTLNQTYDLGITYTALDWRRRDGGDDGDGLGQTGLATGPSD